MRKYTGLFLGILFSGILQARDYPWYSQGDFEPASRLEIVVKNSLDVPRENCGVVIPRADFPYPDIHEMYITVVDPSLPPYAGPSKELLAVQGGHQLQAEQHGGAVFHQLDDLDHDGLWDELFFQTDLEAGEEKVLHIYFGENIRGWNPHFTHVNIGSYCRHKMPFWESEHVGWKIWFANSIDVYGKREPQLMSQRLYMENLDGYGVAKIDPGLGSDLQSVAESFGGGAICLFEYPEVPDSVSRPRFTPVKLAADPHSLWNAGQISDTRYAYIPIVNGPMRSIIKVKTMNWQSGAGFYEVEQLFTVYAHQNYCRSQVRFTRFEPKQKGVQMGCGIRKKPGEEALTLDDGIIISSGPEGIRDPELIDDRQDVMVDFMGKAIVVKEEYAPEYQFVEDKGGNHVFRIGEAGDKSFEFLLFAAWSEGAVLQTPELFEDYVRSTRLEYEHPPHIRYGEMERKASPPAAP